jgi:hypothetical protein
MCHVSSPSLASPKQTVKRYDSPDKTLYAIVVTVVSDTLGPESSVELRRSNGDFIGKRSFTTRVHGGGLGVVNARWSLDSQFFVFSMIASGGSSGGKFPTYFYSRVKNKIIQLDPIVGMWITDPEFYLQSGDLITVTVHDTLPNGAVADTIARSVHLSQFVR